MHDSLALIDRALQINPNLAFAWLYGGWVSIWRGEPERALAHLERAIRLSPQDPQLFQMQTATAYAHFGAGQYEQAVPWAEKALVEHPAHLPAMRVLAASCALSGRQEQASKTIARLREIDPGLRISGLKDIIPQRSPRELEKLAEGLRIAGLPW
jgi:tetratricopeptide (TPR) repeat protein